MRLSIWMSVLVAAVACTATTDNQPVNASVNRYAIPSFADSTQFARLSAFFPVVDQIYADYAKQNNFPAIAYGVIADGRLVHSGATGIANLETNTPATTRTLFHIASMTKSFTAMAIVKLRDEGKLNLSDRVSKYIPEMTKAGALTTDSPDITILNLLTMTAGFPEDNPWADRQLSDTDEELLAAISNGVSFSNAPGLEFEYSNMGFALLGRVVTKVSGTPCERYITENIMKPIGMSDSKWEYDDVPADQLAMGYQWLDGANVPEPLLHQGAYSPIGGLICSIDDFAKYIAFHMDAWPPRNGPDNGPVKRASIREMHQPGRFSGLYPTLTTRAGKPCPAISAYGFGLGYRCDCNGTVRISHSGGLPGFGSEWRMYPDYGIGIVSFSNQRYGAPGRPNYIALDTLIQLAGIQKRRINVSEILLHRKETIMNALPEWSDSTLMVAFAENFFLDQSLEGWRAESRKAFDQIGKVTSVGDMEAQNQLRGSFTVRGEKGQLRIFFTLTPERAALIQHLSVESIPNE